MMPESNSCTNLMDFTFPRNIFFTSEGASFHESKLTGIFYSNVGQTVVINSLRLYVPRFSLVPRLRIVTLLSSFS